MAFDVGTHHQIVAFGPDKMTLFDRADGAAIVNAERAGPEGEWSVAAVDKPDAGTESAATRPEAIQAMVDKALEVLPGDGYSCLVPHGLPEMP